MKFYRKNKYKATKSICFLGHFHPSKLEANYCNLLEMLRVNKQIMDFEIQHKIRIEVDGNFICNHYVDFLVINNKGEKEFHETKGMETSVFRIKKKLVEALYPNIRYIIVK